MVLDLGHSDVEQSGDHLAEVETESLQIVNCGRGLLRHVIDIHYFIVWVVKVHLVKHEDNKGGKGAEATREGVDGATNRDDNIVKVAILVHSEENCADLTSTLGQLEVGAGAVPHIRDELISDCVGLINTTLELFNELGNLLDIILES